MSTPSSSDGVVNPRDRAPQRVLPLVVRVERADPPTRTDALEAAAIAVLTLLADPRSIPTAHPGDSGDPARVGEGVPPDGEPGAELWGGPGDGRPGEWAGAVGEWADARIRKVVRRARGAEWRRAGALPGITVTHGTAEVRVFPPVPLDGWPKDLARLQVSGTDLTDPPDPPPVPGPPAPEPPPAPGPPAPEPPPAPGPPVPGPPVPEPSSAPDPGVPVLWLNPQVELSAGKAMAQVGHAAQLAWNALAPPDRDRWRAAGFALTVRTAAPAVWDRLVASGLPLVRDAGFTEIAAGTATAVADHPALPR